MHTLKEVISEQEIQKRVKELGKEISKVYEGEPLVILCTLKGAFLFWLQYCKLKQRKESE